MTKESNSEELLEQIQELQVRVSFQEDNLQSLNDVIAEQDACISKLQEQLRYFAEKMKQLEASSALSGQPAGDERPPHY
jgi:SlyX protein